MVRPMLTAEERARGQRLGAVLRRARGERSMVEVAALAGVPVETLRKIETGRIPTPAFFTVVALAEAVGVPLGALAATADLDLGLAVTAPGPASTALSA
jgi:transcriptional regulator with XRE-family HTH domain